MIDNNQDLHQINDMSFFLIDDICDNNDDCDGSGDDDDCSNNDDGRRRKGIPYGLVLLVSKKN